MNFELKGKRVLLVEDNRINRESTKEVLEYSGITVDEAENGSVAVEKISSVKPGYYDFVLMDIYMPKKDGYQTTQEIRALADKEIAKVPIIAMTVADKPDDKLKALESGMNAHLSKPVRLENLLATISDMLQSYSDIQGLMSELIS